MTNATMRKLNLLNLNEFANAIEAQEKKQDIYATMSFDERLNMIVDHVYQEKYNEKIRRRIKQVKLRYDNASLGIIDYTSRGLGSLHFIDTYSNIIIQGFTGSGKTFLGCSIAKAACQHDIKTYYI